MMRNSINSYLTTLVMVLALLFSANAFAANTVRSTIIIDDEEYYLYTGFNVITYTDGSVVSGKEIASLVDGVISASSVYMQAGGSGYLEFSSDIPIILKGYIFDLNFEGNYYPTSWTLKAKLNEEDDWDIVSSKSGYKLTGMSDSIACDNSENKAYSYFYLEVESNKVMGLRELRLYGGKDFTYAFRPEKSATCTETGIKKAYYLRSDGRYFADETGTDELFESDFIEPMKPHTCVHHVADEIHVEYWQCSVCGKYFSDEGCTTEITEEKTKNYRVILIDDGVSSLVSSDVSQALAGTSVTLTISHLIDASTLNVNNGAVFLTDIGNRKYTFTMPATEVTVKASLASTYSVNLPDNMVIVSATNAADGNGKFISGTIVTFAASLRYAATNVSDGTNTLEPDADGIYTVTVSTTDINIMATTTESGNMLNLTAANSDFIAVDGDVLSGKTNHTIHIADGATITLSGTTINGGIICDGSATITLVGENIVQGYSNRVDVYKAGIQVGGFGSTLTIRGDGSLIASGSLQSAGIGLSRAWSVDALGGDIVIEGGNITAIGNSQWGSGIGTGVAYKATARLGNITIKGGVVKTIGGKDSDGIGIGYSYTDLGSTNEIGTITIYDTADMVDASSVGKDIVYMHDDIDVSASKNDYFGIIENGERKIIYTGIPAFDVEDQTYTGETITPKPTVSLGSLNFEEGTDYEYSYTNNVYVGTSATVTVTFKGDYAEFGSVSKSFNIMKATPTVEPPTSANPKYAGNCVELVNPGITDFGVILYSIKEDEGYSSDIPCANAAGNYKIYYKVEERDNWSSVEGSVDVSVVNENFTVTFVDAEGETISSDKYPYGTPAERVKLPPENPEKADDEMYAYTFAGWSPEIQDVTGAKTYRPIYGKTRIGFGSATIAADGSWAIIDGKSSKKIDADLDAVEITGDVTLNREFVAEKPSTIVLPFGTHIDNVPGFTFYSFKGVVKENGVWKKVVFDEVDKEGDGHIYANTPYIVVAKEDVGGLIVENGVVFDLNSVRPMSSEDGIWQFVGTYDFKVWNEGDRDIGRSYGFAAEERDGARIGQFVMLGSNAYAYPMRAYLYYAGGNSGESRSMAPALFKAAPAVASIDELPESMDVVIRGEEGTTVIGTINTRTGEFRSAENRWFDLNGRFLGNKKPTIKGTYYNNGKKVIVK